MPRRQPSSRLRPISRSPAMRALLLPGLLAGLVAISFPASADDFVRGLPLQATGDPAATVIGQNDRDDAARVVGPVWHRELAPNELARRDFEIPSAPHDASRLHDDYAGWSVAVDNDLFAPAAHDRDYTGGVGITLSGNAARGWWSLDPALQAIDGALLRGNDARNTDSVYYSAQVGLLSFTPQDIAAREVLEDDRPYASLLYSTGVRQYLSADEKRIRHTGLTVGVLGLSLTSDIHGAIHDAVGSEKPRGYHNQVSAGGEPTLRYFISDSKLHSQRLALGSGLFELKTTAELSVGYLTETSYAVSARMGAINTPWWTFGPERVDYIAQPSAVPSMTAGEFYFWAGAKVRLRAYNSFLQGQFRDSEHTFGGGELRHVIGEAWIGLTGQLTNGTQMSYAVRYQTTEIRNGIGRRSPVWAGVTFTRSF